MYINTYIQIYLIYGLAQLQFSMELEPPFILVIYVCETTRLDLENTLLCFKLQGYMYALVDTLYLYPQKEESRMPITTPSSKKAKQTTAKIKTHAQFDSLPSHYLRKT